MRIDAATDKLVSNYEVFQHLNSLASRTKRPASKHKNRRGELKNLDIAVSEVLSYLTQRPAGNPAGPQTGDHVTLFLRNLDEFCLEKAEKLQLVNSAPTSMAVLYNLVEECEQRLTPDQCQRLLDLCAEHLGFEPLPETGSQA